ncbi:meiotically up-regulated gene 113-domain-containing protein [Chlamydoabsidia padenii]|nr:meiotically up-regulated gene 113-domain-containing protein [Chlamydoabsidia padenii]
MFFKSYTRFTFSLFNQQHPQARLVSYIQLIKKKSIPTKRSASPLVFQTCAGLRKRDGQPCKRRVPVDSTKLSKNLLAYCHDHNPTTLTPFVTSISTQTKRSIECSPIYDCWSLWIGKHIGPRKRQQIQQEMVKPLSPKDESGYLYAYRLTSGPRVSTDKYCYFKIGRTTNPTRRMGSVVQKCQHQPELLDILPAPGRSFSRRCPFSHRVERLIHIELSAMYPITGNAFKCQGCGSEHREWFRVKRPWVGKRSMTDQEVWAERIRPVMLHWIKYGVAISAISQATGSSYS